MNTLAVVQSFAYALAHLVGFVDPSQILAVNTSTGTKIADTATQFITPILFLVIGAVAITFLFKRQMTQFFQFAAIAVLVAVLFFNPGIIKNIADWVATIFK